MKKSFIDISDKIETYVLDIFELILDVSSALDLKFIVVGATARELILEKGFNLNNPRATRDIDLAIYMSSWDDFEKFKESLFNTKKFTASREFYRVMFDGKFPIDIIPFGKIESHRNQISWPPEYTTVLNVLGFEEAFNHSLLFRLRNDPALDISVASIPCLAALKIISWKDCHVRSKKDGQDLAYFMRSYLDAGNKENLYSEHSDLINDDFNYLHVSARLLGRHMANVLLDNTRKNIVDILTVEIRSPNRHKLIEDMSIHNQFEENLILVEKLLKGIQEISRHR